MASLESRSLRRSLLACAIAASFALSAGGTAAQNNNKDEQSSKATAEAKRAAKDGRKDWEQTHRASKIIGSEVRSSQDHKVGRVKDLVLSDPASGTISHVVVSVGGVAGMGEKLFAVPFRELTKVRGKDHLVLSATSDLSKGFDDKNWPAESVWQDRGDASRTVAAPAAPPTAAATPTAPVATPSTATPAAPVATPSTATSASTTPSAAETPSPTTTQ